MVPFKKILFAVDYSGLCRATAPYVDEMTRHFAAHLTVVHAYENTDWLKQVDDRGERQFREFVAEAFPSHQDVDAFLEEGDPASAIEKLVRKQESDLVIMPTHGANAIGRLYSGSLTEKLLHDLRAAVWTCTGWPLARHPREVSYKSLLCAVDFSQETEAVLRAGAALASSYNAHLSLVHVVEKSEPHLINAANDRLLACKDKLGISAPHKILSGNTAGAIRQEAVEEAADLLVVGRGLSKGTLSRFMSHLYETICEAPCPVLSI
jgi:nucleotide-binding universal stress UspA family protein